MVKVIIPSIVFSLTAGWILLWGLSAADFEAYEFQKTRWLGRLDTTQICLPIALRLVHLPPKTTFDQFRTEIFARSAISKFGRDQAIFALDANPLTPDFVLKNRLAIIEITIDSGSEDPIYGSHCGTTFSWLHQ